MMLKLDRRSRPPFVTRYEGPEDAAADVQALRGADVIIRVEPGDVRAWDYADEIDMG